MRIHGLPSHPLRIELSNELHARPYPVINGPCQIAAIAIERDASKAGSDVAFLNLLLKRHDAPLPAPGASHYKASLGKVQLKWEQHTEFNSFTLISDGLDQSPFSAELLDYFSPEWLSQAPGRLLSSILVRLETCETADAARNRIAEVGSDWFLSESLASSFVMDQDAVVAGDFRLDQNDHIRFAVLQIGSQNTHRMGHIVQRIIEIETYKTMALLTLPVARDVFARLSDLDLDMGQIIAKMASSDGTPQQSLDQLLEISSRVESFSADTAFRFTASEAYADIVHQRIVALREERMFGEPMFEEFMNRRFKPAMMTCQSARARLSDISGRASRASRLLSTRVMVDANAQNVSILSQMDNRAALQLRMQKTVEGLSVVAISYYLLNLLHKLLLPMAEVVNIAPKVFGAALVVPVIVFVWLMVRRLVRKVDTLDTAPKS